MRVWIAATDCGYGRAQVEIFKTLPAAANVFRPFRAGHFLRIAHHGAGTEAPANSLEAITKAWAMRVDMIEIDVRATADRHLILYHDHAIEDVRGRRMRIARHTLAELRVAMKPETELATLDEAIERVNGRFLLNLDVKTSGYEDAVAEVFRRYNLRNNAMICSSLPASLQRIRSLNPRIFTALTYPDGDSPFAWMRKVPPARTPYLWYNYLTLPYRIEKMLRRASARGTTLYHGLVRQHLVDVLHKHDIPLYIWTVDDPGRMAKKYALGVDGITSNRLHLFRSLE